MERCIAVADLSLHVIDLPVAVIDLHVHIALVPQVTVGVFPCLGPKAQYAVQGAQAPQGQTISVGLSVIGLYRGGYPGADRLPCL